MKVARERVISRINRYILLLLTSYLATLATTTFPLAIIDDLMIVTIVAIVVIDIVV